MKEGWDKVKTAQIFIALALSMLIVSGCAGMSSGSAIEEKSWVLSEINGKPPIEGTLVTVEFSDGAITGTGGCNSYFGEYRLASGSLSIESLGMTEMYCMDPEGVSEQETVYLTALSVTEAAAVVNGQLVLTGLGGSTLVFDPA